MIVITIFFSFPLDISTIKLFAVYIYDFVLFIKLLLFIPSFFYVVKCVDTEAYSGIYHVC